MKRPTITEDQCAKLPKWAQEHLQYLNLYTTYLEHDRDRVVTQTEPTQIMVDWQPTMEKQCYLLNDSRVMFMFGVTKPQGHLRNFIEVSFDHNKPGLLNLHGSGQLSVHTKYTNGCAVSVER